MSVAASQDYIANASGNSITSGRVASQHTWTASLSSEGYMHFFRKLLGLFLGNHDRAGATSLEWPTETALVVAVGHCNGVTQAFTLEQFH